MHRSTRELLEQFQSIGVCQLADALGPSCAPETEIRPLDPDFRIWGPAVTVLCAPDDNLTLHHALHVARPGEVLVVSAGRSYGAALWGQLMSISAQSRNLRGTILDGAARDCREIARMAYPVFCRTVTPRRARKEKYGSLNVPVRCGSLEVNPGDIIFADVNGMLAIPETNLEEALRLALEVAKKEADIEARIRSGLTVFEILQLQKHLPVKTKQRQKKRRYSS